jgi:hypothetical protein
MGFYWRDISMDDDQKKSEFDFNNWLESIKFVDTFGKEIPPVLTKDDSDDPEGERIK